MGASLSGTGPIIFEERTDGQRARENMDAVGQLGSVELEGHDNLDEVRGPNEAYYAFQCAVLSAAAADVQIVV